MRAKRCHVRATARAPRYIRLMSGAAFRFTVSLALACASASVSAIEPVTSLHCARKAAGLERAELRMQRTGPHEVLIRFSRVRPSPRQLDWALRECLETASKLDSSRDIFASASYSEETWAGAWKEIVEPLAPRGPAGSRAIYRASSGRVMVVHDGH